MPDPFISAQDLVDYLGRGSVSDPGMIIATDAACDICRTIAQQQFNAGTTTLALDGTGTDALRLPELPVNNAGTVTVAGAAIEDFMLNGHGVLLRGTAGSNPRPLWPKGRQNVTVTYDHGFTTIDMPRDVRMVALSIAARLVVQGPAIQEQIGAVTVRYGTNATDLTNGEKAILRKYRRPVA
jgi:hypothetical protein